ncbi:RcnB family protein [Acerihabitans sp. KWT182]|uniref:RcnB family protein n=1 Tax=Acerihabitans sp. KWT182 TaxID=3157919 RepID=A0AAU7Q837_9GAMM
MKFGEIMGKSKVVLFSAVLLMGALPFVSSAYADTVVLHPTDTPSPNAPALQSANPPAASTDNSATTPSQNPPAVHSYEIQSFYLDSKQYKIGDIVPDLYRTKPYEIVQWNIRNLPAPDEGTHWTYMGGNYVLITNDDGKIMKAETGDIFFQM